jgi:hypothetical protein
MQENTLDKLSKLTGMNSKLMEMAKIADRFALPESVQRMIDTQNKFKALLPKIEIPTYNFPKFDIPEQSCPK